MTAGRGRILNREQVRSIDRIAIQEYGIPGIVLMENAGNNAATLMLDRTVMVEAGVAFDDIQRVVILCGAGNNGGDGFVIARHLANRNHWDIITVLVGDSQRLSEDCRVNHDICSKMGLPIESDAPPIDGSDLIVDAILGTGFSGNVREPAASIIDTVNASRCAGVVAIDVPSGLDCDTGESGNVAIRANLTITFAANKIGFRQPAAIAHIGRVHVADIGAPRAIIDRVRHATG